MHVYTTICYSDFRAISVQTCLVHEVKANLTEMMAGWRSLQSDTTSMHSVTASSVDIVPVLAINHPPPNSITDQQV